nr:MAK10-like protein [Tanacetum cinerariifolium]
MASFCGSKSKSFMTMLIPPQDEPLTNRPVAIFLPQDLLSTSDRRLIELENQVQHMMEAHIAPKQPIQVYKITSSCEICSGPHDTQYCLENPKQAFVEYASSRTDEAKGKWYTFKPEQNNLGYTYNTSWKSHPNLRIKGKEIVDIATQKPSAATIVLGMFKLDLEPLAPSVKKVVVTPKNNVKKVRFAEPLTSSSNIKQGSNATDIPSSSSLVMTGCLDWSLKASDYDNSDLVPQIQHVFPLVDTIVSSQQELDLLFGPSYDEFFNAGTSSVNKSSSPIDNSKQRDTPPTTNIQSSIEPSNPTNANAEENNDNQAEHEFSNPFCTPVQEVSESSPHNVGNSNVHTFNQPQVFEYL